MKQRRRKMGIEVFRLAWFLQPEIESIIEVKEIVVHRKGVQVF
jgi:hypothetical protein